MPGLVNVLSAQGAPPFSGSYQNENYLLTALLELRQKHIGYLNHDFTNMHSFVEYVSIFGALHYLDLCQNEHDVLQQPNDSSHVSGEAVHFYVNV